MNLTALLPVEVRQKTRVNSSEKERKKEEEEEEEEEKKTTLLSRREEERIKRSFEELTSDQRRGLVKKFKVDLEMFGYSYREYLPTVT